MQVSSPDAFTHSLITSHMTSAEYCDNDCVNIEIFAGAAALQKWADGLKKIQLNLDSFSLRILSRS